MDGERYIVAKVDAKPNFYLQDAGEIPDGGMYRVKEAWIRHADMLFTPAKPLIEMGCKLTKMTTEARGYSLGGKSADDEAKDYGHHFLNFGEGDLILIPKCWRGRDITQRENLVVFEEDAGSLVSRFDLPKSHKFMRSDPAVGMYVDFLTLDPGEFKEKYFPEIGKH